MSLVALNIMIYLNIRIPLCRSFSKVTIKIMIFNFFWINCLILAELLRTLVVIELTLNFMSA